MKCGGEGRRETTATFFAMKSMENGETNKNVEQDMGKSMYEEHGTAFAFASVIWLPATEIYSVALDVWRGGVAGHGASEERPC